MICFRPDNSCWCAFSNVDQLCVFSNYKALIIVFCIVSGNSFGNIYRYLMWLCLCLFFGNTSIPLSLCQYLYTSSMAISLSLLNDNISMPLLWQYLFVFSMAISLCLFYDNFSMPPLWQYLYASSMAISLCLFYGNISMPLLWQCLYASSMSIPLISLLWQYIVAATSNIHLLLRNISFCFCEQSSLEISLLLRSIRFIGDKYVYGINYPSWCFAIPIGLSVHFGTFSLLLIMISTSAILEIKQSYLLLNHYYFSASYYLSNCILYK